ncbi:flocculation protein FLO11 isoform X1 [Oncorhynchus mykiss]|uniref:flocculation protein FLO11 isoform X1 n=2 Tax=Oncorhynchus mykiss TaxID=8022 RepID=UPI0018783163|nr:flocculation protein FLO11 isoform X1 [Oncorhynchus mykiss]XP_036791108.1 flocculation protein FLO11 isoform X1 [Oncorhynchus mykiss]
MAAEGATEKRANLVASKVMWSNRDDVPMSAPERSHGSDRAGICRQNNVQQWLRSHEADAKPDHTREAAAGLLKRNASSEDDLALGVEASLYGKQGVRTVQEFLRGSRSSPVLTRWNSLTSAFSAQSAPLSVMDVLNLWSDDPEEVLLDLGFGCDEPDISGRIPARFINNQSSARGINIQVFLDAQKNRMDIENPDVSNRFRQLEVLQQVTTAFSSLVGGASTDSLSESGVPALASAEAREKRKRMGMLLRRVSRKTLSQTQIQTQDSQDTNPTPHSPVAHLQQPLAGPPDRRTPLKRARQGLAESICLTPLVEEQGLASEAPEPHSVPQEGALRLEVGKEYQPLISSGIPTRKKSPGEARESFEMEEIQSFDEGSISGSYMGASDTTAVCVMRTNSCQSDSSGFLEEPFIPSITQHPSPGPELMKALSGISGGSTDSQITVKGASPPSSPPSTSLDPSPPSLSTCHPRPESPLYRPETTSPTEETPRHQDFPTPHSLLSDALEMTNSAFGARPSLMENTVTEEDGFSSACCAPCHKPDSPLRHVIIIMKTDRETEHFTLESEEAVPIEGEEKAIAEQSGNVQTGTEAVGDQDTDCYGSHEGSLMDSVALVQMKEEMEMKMEVQISSGLEGPVLGPIAVPEVVDQGSETGSVCQDRSSEDPLLGSDPNLSAVLSPASSLPAAEPLSASSLPPAEPPSASSPPPVHWETGGSEISEGSSSLVVQEPVPPLNQPTNPSTDLPPGPALTSPSEQVSLPSPAYSPPPSPSPASCPHQPPASAFLAASSSSPTQSHSPIPNHPLSALTTTPIPSSIPNSPSAHSLTVAPSQAPTPLVPHSGAFRSGRSVSVQMPSSLPSVSHSALRRGAVPHTPSPLGPSFEPLPLTDLTLRQRRNSFSRKAWSDADVSHLAEHRNTAVAMGKADMTPETISLPSPCPSPSMSSSNRWLSRDGSRRSGSFQMKSTSLDTGLWQEEVGEEVGDEDRRWERALFSGLSCCCSCDNRCRCCSQNNRLKPSSVSAFPYSLDELEGMMHCMRKFRCVLTDIEEQLSEDQASVYSSLSDTDREEVRDILELRKAVKQEAGELELQLTDLVHRYDDSFKMKMHRLLDEQSHLYTQLRLLPLIPTTTSTPGSASSRSMATQCCLLPWLPLTDMSRPRPSSQATWDLESRSALPDSSSMGQRLKHGSTGTKPDKLDIVGFIQRLKESIRHSVNTDSLE